MKSHAFVPGILAVGIAAATLLMAPAHVMAANETQAVEGANGGSSDAKKAERREKRAQRRAYCKEHPDECKKQHEEYCAKHPDRCGPHKKKGPKSGATGDGGSTNSQPAGE